MPTQVDQKVMDPEAELSNVMRKFKNLAPQCSIAKRALGIPQLAPQEKQIGILKYEMQETKLCINLAKKGRHALRDASVKKGIHECIIEYENLELELRDERQQRAELDLLNYLSTKTVLDMSKMVPTESDELANMENAYNRVCRMENRLDLAIKRFSAVNADNQKIRDEIHRLLIERNNFNIQWNRTINNLMKGKEYMMDVLEIATNAFNSRDEACRILDTLKWKGLFQLNRDICEMQVYDGELNHLAKLEEFLRVKGSKRLCEADEKAEARRLDEIARCEQEILRYDELLNDIFTFAGSDHVSTVIRDFNETEIENFSMFELLCEVMQESILLRKELNVWRHRLLDQQDINQGREEKQGRRLGLLSEELEAQKLRTRKKLEQNKAAEEAHVKILKAFDDFIRLAKCEFTPLLSLLGNHKEVTKWNVMRFIKILEVDVKSLIQVVYGTVKPPGPTPSKGKTAVEEIKVIADPHVVTIRPNKIENLVPYQPCAYCVEDYIMNLVYETPAVPADKKYVENVLHLEDVNTKFGIFTLTNPAKRHPFRDVNKDKK